MSTVSSGLDARDGDVISVKRENAQAKDAASFGEKNGNLKDDEMVPPAW